MTYTTLRQGSTGDEVRKLQNALKDKGYDVGNAGADGIYGSNTAAAVKKYQQDNGLQVDSIAGNETLGHLYSAAQNPSGSSAATSPAGEAGTVQTPAPAVPSAESEAVAQAQALLDEQLGKKPAAYESEWRQQADGILDEYMNRDKFSYDVNEDALYQQLQDQFVQSGRMAMMDTMGQAAALTGGYGSSFGQMVGQQAYQSHMQQLTEKIPELYQLARENYDAEGQALLEKFALISEMDDREYSRYMDQLNAWMTERDYLTGRLDTAKGFEYQAKQDAIAQDQWERQFAEQQRQYEESMGLTKEQWEWEKAHAGHSGGSGGGGLYGSGDIDGEDDENDPSENAIKQMQMSLGLEATGVWDQASQKTTGIASAAEAYSLWNKGQMGNSLRLNEGVVRQFMAGLHSEKEHDAVMRDKWGSYKQYIAYQIEHSNLSDAEKAWLITRYGIQEADTHYKNA